MPRPITEAQRERVENALSEVEVDGQLVTRVAMPLLDGEPKYAQHVDVLSVNERYDDGTALVEVPVDDLNLDFILQDPYVVREDYAGRTIDGGWNGIPRLPEHQAPLTPRGDRPNWPLVDDIPGVRDEADVPQSDVRIEYVEDRTVLSGELPSHITRAWGTSTNVEGAKRCRVNGWLEPEGFLIRRLGYYLLPAIGVVVLEDTDWSTYYRALRPTVNRLVYLDCIDRGCPRVRFAAPRDILDSANADAPDGVRYEADPELPDESERGFQWVRRVPDLDRTEIEEALKR